MRHRRHFWRRIAIIAACALLATVASWVLFPRTFIYFGILHAIAVASVLAWPLVRRPRAALAIGVAVIVAGHRLVASDVRCASAFLDRIRDGQARDRGLRAARAVGRVRGCSGIAVGHRLARQRFRALAPLAAAPGGSAGSGGTASSSTWSTSRSCSGRYGSSCGIDVSVTPPRAAATRGCCGRSTPSPR